MLINVKSHHNDIYRALNLINNNKILKSYFKIKKLKNFKFFLSNFKIQKQTDTINIIILMAY